MRWTIVMILYVVTVVVVLATFFILYILYKAFLKRFRKKVSEAEAKEKQITGESEKPKECFGSGSGLLGLSLQADDTSLGGILDDEIGDEIIDIAQDKELNDLDILSDSFGSGSGLLGLSLQADDTSLGGILDEIYQAEEHEEPFSETEGERQITISVPEDIGKIKSITYVSKNGETKTKTYDV